MGAEAEFDAAPAYLKFQVTRERLNLAVASINAAVVQHGVGGGAWAGALTDEGLKEALVMGAIQGAGEAADGAKTILLCLHKLHRVKMERSRGLVHLSFR